MIDAKLGLLTKVAGTIIFLFGMVKLGAVQWLFPLKELWFNWNQNRWGFAGAALLEAAFLNRFAL